MGVVDERVTPELRGSAMNAGSSSLPSG
jgi:hypothetical protein